MCINLSPLSYPLRSLSKAIELQLPWLSGARPEYGLSWLRPGGHLLLVCLYDQLGYQGGDVNLLVLVVGGGWIFANFNLGIGIFNLNTKNNYLTANQMFLCGSFPLKYPLSIWNLEHLYTCGDPLTFT